MTRIAVIGAGPFGLMALKNLLEDGFDVTAYETRSWIGGLWNYSADSQLSVAEATVFNTSKYRSAISDYPFPDDTDDYPTWQQMCAYLNDYVDHFGLRKHIRLNSCVTSLDRQDGYWVLEVTPDEGPVRQDIYDKVVIATGTFVKPKWPKFQGIDRFAGRTLHAMDFHDGLLFDNKNVLLIGLHASAQDVASGLDGHAKKVYASHRNGVNLLPMYTSKGAPLDVGMSVNFLFFQLFAQTWFPRLFAWILDKVIRSESSRAFPSIPKSWNFLPAPSIATTGPLVAEQLWPLLERGFVEPCDAVDEVIGPKSLRLRGGRVLEDIDAIIYCTGYDICTPCVPQEWNPYQKPGDVPYLYRHCFSLHRDPAVRESLAFLGQGAAPFPGFVAHEALSMAVSQVWKGNSKLPPYEEQKLWHDEYMGWRKQQMKSMKTESTFYTAFLPFPDHIRFLDDAAGIDVLKHFGWFNTRAWSFWWRDRELYQLIKSGLFSPAIWRLFEGGKRRAWPGARAQIIRDNELLKEGIERKQKAMKEKAEQQRKDKSA